MAKKRSDYFTEKKLFYREKDHCAIFIRIHFMWDLRFRVGAKLRFRVRVGVGLGNRLN